MKYTHLGKSGLAVSKLCLGTGHLNSKTDKEESLRILNKAFDSGLVFWDTADIYGRDDPLLNWQKTSWRAQEVIGEWIQQSGSREQLIISSKSRWPTKFSINHEGLSRKHIRRSIKKTLDVLQTDYLDLYFAHGDDRIPRVVDILSFYNSLVTKGDILAHGLSNFQNYRIMEFILEARYNNFMEPSVIQSPYSLSDRFGFEYELPNLVRDQNLGTMIYSPLDTGFLTAEYGKEDIEMAEKKKRAGFDKMNTYRNNDQKWEILEVLKNIGSDQDCLPLQVAHGWLLAKESVDSIIIGVSELSQLDTALASLDITLTRDQIRQLDEVSDNSENIPWWHSMFTDDYLEWIEETIQNPIEKQKMTIKQLLFE